jgi:hypothetical protein
MLSSESRKVNFVFRSRLGSKNLEELFFPFFPLQALEISQNGQRNPWKNLENPSDSLEIFGKSLRPAGRTGRRDTFRIAVHSLQLWINPPASAKMTAPGYRDLIGSRVPARREAGVEIRVFSGASGGCCRARAKPRAGHVG